MRDIITSTRALNAMPVGDRYWKPPADTVSPTDLAPQLYPSLSTGRLPADYRGPVLVANVKDISDAYYGPLVGTQPLLQQVAALGVPIVYCTPKRDDKTDKALSVFPPGVVATKEDFKALHGDPKTPLTSLQGLWPGASLFVLGNSSGSDAQEAASIGARAYLRNTDATQKKIPAGFKPVISDDYTPAVRARILSDLHLALGQAGPMVPAPENPSPRAPVSFGDKLASINQIGIAPLGGLPATISHAVVRRLENVSDTAAALLQSHPHQLRADMATDLASRASAVIVGRGLDGTARSQTLMHVVRAFGADAGARDRVLSRLDKPDAFATHLTPADKAEFDAIVHRTAAVPGDWDGFQHYMDHLTQTREVGGSTMLPCIDGDQLMAEKTAAIGRAKKFVNFANFKLLSDANGWKMAQALMDAADRGCKVRVFYDTVGSSKTDGLPTDPRLLQELRAHGVEVLTNKIVYPAGESISHMKVMSMDNGTDDGGLVAFNGGHNISNNYTTRWHEVDARIMGPAAAQVSRIFIDHYRANGGQVPVQDERVMTTPGPDMPDGGKVRNIVHEALKDSDFKYAYIRAIDTAQRNIRIASPYLSDPDVIEHLQAAARRGVDVLLMMPHHNEKPPIQDIEKSHYQDMLAAGIRIQEFNGLPMAHEKVATFDDTITTIGSSNLDMRSIRNNTECNAWSSDPRVAADLNRRLFDADMPTSIPVTAYNPGLKEALKNHLFRRLDWFL